MSQWEYRKRSFTGRETSIDEIFVPQAILRELESTLDGNVPEALDSGIIELDPARMRTFFDPVVHSIIRLIQSQIRSLAEARGTLAETTNHVRVGSTAPSLTDASDVAAAELAAAAADGPVLEHMFVVGGFGNSVYLRQRIAEDPVIAKLVRRVRSIPSPEVAVLRGAVYAAVGDSIRSRRARRSIGVQILRPFDGAIDDAATDVVMRDPRRPHDPMGWLVDTAVETFIQRGDPMPLASHYAKHHFSLSPGSWTADINLYASAVRGPLLHTRIDRCEFLGRVTIDARPLVTGVSGADARHGAADDSGASTTSDLAPWSKRDLSISIYFGRVELEVCVTDAESGRTWRTILGHGHTVLPLSQ
ncbi:hypothetical protein BC828DRAFT_40074 [Blastocladiella britannica]|nr:hypothetical protein BC828DRAFT_40074 [Blastocladiella britannica]